MNDVSGLSSQVLMNSMFWGITYFIVLLAPIYIYMRHFISKDESEKNSGFHETAAQALVLQVGVLIVFTMIGSFIDAVGVNNSSLKPSKAFVIFFGDGSELIDERWRNQLRSFSTNSAAQTQMGSEAKGAAFLANQYIGIAYRLFLLISFFLFLGFIFISLTRKFRDGEQEINLFSRLYSTFVTVIFFVLLIGVHSMVAKSLPVFFGVNETAVAVDAIAYFQKIISETLYSN